MYSSIFLVSYLFDFIYYTNLFIICIFYIGPLSTRQARYYMKIPVLIMFLWMSMTMTIRLLGAPLPVLPVLIFLSNSNSDDISDVDYDSSCVETCYPVGLKSDCGGQVSESLANDTKKRIIHQPLQKHAIIYFVFLIN
jgi:hypothetical protein